MKIVNRFTNALILEIDSLLGADLNGANLIGADLIGADLYGVIGNMREIKSKETT